MDAEALKSVFPVLGGALALAGGVFTFVSGRLRDADGAEGQTAVIRRTWSWLAIGLSTAALIATLAMNLYVVSVVLFSASFIVQMHLYLTNPAPPHRAEVLVVALMCASLLTSLAMAGTFSLFERVIDLQRRTIQVQHDLIQKLQGAPEK
jgi:hypothetical protein